MIKTTSPLDGLSDEEILDEFVKRFECDGAILIYLDSNTEYGFAKWANSTGKKWATNLFTLAQSSVNLPGCIQEICEYENVSAVTA